MREHNDQKEEGVEKVKSSVMMTMRRIRIQEKVHVWCSDDDTVNG